jgi:hypothetical protein
VVVGSLARIWGPGMQSASSSRPRASRPPSSASRASSRGEYGRAPVSIMAGRTLVDARVVRHRLSVPENPPMLGSAAGRRMSAAGDRHVSCAYPRELRLPLVAGHEDQIVCGGGSSDPKVARWLSATGRAKRRITRRDRLVDRQHRRVFQNRRQPSQPLSPRGTVNRRQDPDVELTHGDNADGDRLIDPRTADANHQARIDQNRQAPPAADASSSRSARSSSLQRSSTGVRARIASRPSPPQARAVGAPRRHGR